MTKSKIVKASFLCFIKLYVYNTVIHQYSVKFSLSQRQWMVLQIDESLPVCTSIN